MSQDALEQFMTQVEGSADLQARIGEEIEADALVALGAAHGCEFTVEDVRAGGTALNDEQLEAVAGGSPHIRDFVVGKPDRKGSKRSGGVGYNCQDSAGLFRVSFGNRIDSK